MDKEKNVIQFELPDDPKSDKKPKKNKKKRNGKPNVVVYIISVLIMLGTIYHSYRVYSSFASYDFIPEKYIRYSLIGLIAVNSFFAIYAFLPVNNLNKILQSMLCSVLAALLAIVTTLIPTYIGKLERTFTDIPTEGDLNINVYVLKDSSITDITELKGKKVAVQMQLDYETQDYALKVINRELGGENMVKVECSDIFTALDSLYGGESDVLLLNESYLSIVTNNLDFTNFENETRKVYTCTKKVSLAYDSGAVGDITSEPFIVMVGGNDQWDYYDILHDEGRTDVNLLTCINPNTKQILMITIPRDSYLNLWGKTGCPDKLTHSTWYGIDCWEETIEKMLDVKINYYIRVGFSSIINIVDAIGGVDVYNPYTFTCGAIWYNSHSKADSVVFEEGPLHLNGAEALGYCRDRANLSDSDLGRNKHQAIVLKGIIDKVTSVEGITHIGDLFDAVNGTFKTDISMNQIYALAQMQLDDMANWSLVQYSISGTYGLDSCYIMGLNSPTKYDVVYLNQETIDQAKIYINQIMNNKIVSIK